MTARVLAVKILDSRVAVHGLDPPLLSRAQRLFACFPQVDPDTADVALHVSSHGTDWVMHSQNCDAEIYHNESDVLLALTTAINGSVLKRTGYLAMHAGVVAYQGAAVVLPGDSGTGKSTLTAACLLNGMSYLSDEALCVVDDTAYAVPYSRPLGLSPTSLRLLGIRDTYASTASGPAGEHMVAPADIGAEVVPFHQAVPVHHVVLPVRGYTRTGLVELPTSTAVTTLLTHAFNAYVDPRRAVHVIARLARGAKCWRLEYGNAGQAAALLRQQLFTGSGCSAGSSPEEPS